MKRFTLADLAKTPAAKANPGLFEQSGNAGKLKKKSKYGNVKVETEDGIFDSKREAKRARELRLLLKAGKTIVEDVKGMRTAVYKKKAALMLKVHGISIVEI